MIEVKQFVPLAPLTTFQIGGDAEYFVEVKTEDELREAIRFARDKHISFTILSGGSNMLLPDNGVKGLVIHFRSGDFSFAGTELAADAGCDLLALIQAASVKGLGGWEKLSGIPGSVGGAVRGNAGAFGSEIKDFVVLVRALDSNGGDIREFQGGECDFSYRHSFFKDNSIWVITRVFLDLQKIDSTESVKISEETIAEREKRHLQNVKAAGSFFMNPVVPSGIVEMFEKEKGVKSRENRVPAGWLIEKAGMKGSAVGGAQASLQHPNYIVNTGNATAQNVRTLAENIKIAVKSMFGVHLQEEAMVL